MNKTLQFSVGSVSRAIHGQRILRRNGFRSWVRRRTQPAGDGCGYTLDVVLRSPAEESVVRRLLSAAGIPLLEQRESGWDG
ncbi:MAG: hypothetical protein IKI63_02245 [Clostridia bacterium]|nr:hypothetical protein [Clostridia bacterium]